MMNEQLAMTATTSGMLKLPPPDDDVDVVAIITYSLRLSIVSHIRGSDFIAAAILTSPPGGGSP